jgi:hypothetical protein
MVEWSNEELEKLLGKFIFAVLKMELSFQMQSKFMVRIGKLLKHMSEQDQRLNVSLVFYVYHWMNLLQLHQKKSRIILLIKTSLETIHLIFRDTTFTTVFKNATNPLMTQLKFLSAVVGEQIGEEAAKSAYDSLLGKYAEDLSTTQNKEDIKPLLVKQLEKKLEPEDVQVGWICKGIVINLLTSQNAISRALKTAALAAITNAEKEDQKVKNVKRN